MITQDQSESFFNESLKPALEDVEILRKRILEKGKRNKLLLSGFGILVFLYSYTAVQEWADTPIQKFWMSALLIIILVTTYIMLRPEFFLPRNERNRIYKRYTNGVVREMLRKINKTFNYTSIFKTNIRLFERSQIFTHKITAYQETYGIIGKYNDVEIKISEVEFKHNLLQSFLGWFINFDKELDIEDFGIFKSYEANDKWDSKNGFSLKKDNDLRVYTKEGKECPVTKKIIELFKVHQSNIGRNMYLTVIDKKLFIAIENDDHFFQLSFRDDNHNYFGSYMDFNRTALISNFVESLVECTNVKTTIEK